MSQPIPPTWRIPSGDPPLVFGSRLEVLVTDAFENSRGLWVTGELKGKASSCALVQADTGAIFEVVCWAMSPRAGSSQCVSICLKPNAPILPSELVGKRLTEIQL